MMEYGGYLPIELGRKQEFYTGANVLTFNCARSAIEYIIKINSYKTVYLPYYLCESVKKAIEKHDVDLRFYHINQEFMPLIEAIEDTAVIVITNYFGVKNNDEKYVKLFGNVIFDNTQAFFERPISGAYNVYSCRKFFGVCDGAYIVINEPFTLNIKYKAYEPRHIGFLLEPYMSTTNNGYRSSVENERQLSEDGIRDMSNLSRKILESIDYKRIIDARTNNYAAIREVLDELNAMDIFSNVGSVPMVYPLLINRKDVRHKLVESHIYIPQWWKYLLECSFANEFERRLSEYLLPIPIDQRYSPEQVKKMAECIKTIILS